MFVYLDNSATTKPLEEVKEEMVQCLSDDFGNPSSLHRLGLNAEKKIKSAREKVGKSLNVPSKDIIFTSGGTEADNMIIYGAIKALKRKGNKIITSKVEHSAVLNTYKALEQEGFDVHYVDVDQYGNINTEELESVVDDQTVLISIMHANNEIGTIQPLDKIGKIKNKFDHIIFHTDAVQSYGKIKIDVKSWHLDAVSLSAHKLHGPKGIGALYLNGKKRIEPMIHGGGQEQNVRSGTENVPGIVGLGVAAEMAHKQFKQDQEHIMAVKTYFADQIKNTIDDIKINSYLDERCLPNLLSVSFLGIRGEVLLHMLEEQSIYVSTGSACSSNSKSKSKVLTQIGLTNDEIEGTIRFSLSKFNTKEEIDYVMTHLVKSVAYIRKVMKR